MPEHINDVRPFRALHYDPERVGDCGACLSQPYDVISAEMQEAYYRQHPHNVVRLILNRAEPGDDERANRYTRSRDLLRQWQKEGVLRTAKRPSFYAYEQEFELPEIGRRKVMGYIGLLRLHDYDEGAVLPHEKIMPKPMEDRVRLTEVLGTQSEYIWGLYRDPAGAIDETLERSSGQSPVVDYLEPGTGVRHRLWQVADGRDCDTVRRTMEPLKVYIADGHHRYQAMLTVRDRMRRLCPDDGPEAPWEYLMMFLVNTEQKGLTILPTHRLLHGLPEADLAAFEGRLRDYFHVESFPFHDGDAGEARRKWMNGVRDAAPGEHRFGAYIAARRRFLLLTLKDPKAYERLMDPASSRAWKFLDVNVLNTLILNRIVGLTDEQLAQQSHVAYTQDAREAVQAVDSGRAQVALVLNATRLGDILTIADNGERMPRKSTFFYPKPLSGLVFYPMAESLRAPEATPPVAPGIRAV